MFKKILSFVLLVLICCSASMNPFYRAEHSNAEDKNVFNGSNEHVIANVTSVSSEIVTEKTETLINPDYIVTGKVDSEYMDWIFGAPDEILSASTVELLEYFLESPFMGLQIYSCSSTSKQREIDFSCHEAFRELVSRKDCIEVLENYAGSILHSPENDTTIITKFKKILSQPLVKSLISDLPSASCPNLQSIYAET